MKNNSLQYHIDTTPEEDKLFQTNADSDKFNFLKTRTGFTKIFTFVFGLHVLIAGLVSCQALLSNKENTNVVVEGSRKPLEPDITKADINNIMPKEFKEAAKQQAVASSNKQQQRPKQSSTDRVEADNLTKTYTVQHGDTISSISIKYKLNKDTLIKLNNIKNPDKIVVGQKLKFL